MQNKVILIGNLGANPELKTTQNNKNVLSIGLATNEVYKNDKDERIEKTEWHNLVFFGNRAVSLSKYCKKGSKIAIEGKLQTRTYTDKSGVDKYITEIVVNDVLFLDKKE